MGAGVKRPVGVTGFNLAVWNVGEKEKMKSYFVMGIEF